MIGMIKKDLYMIRNNYKALGVALVIYLFYSITFNMDMSFFLPFMGLMICISTINYDEYNNWHTYAASLPQGRINIIKSKYITTLIVVALLTIVSLISSTIIGNIRGSFDFIDTLSTMFGMLLAIIVIMSVLYPVLFKYGYEKGRLAMMLIGVSIMGLFVLFTKVVKINVSANFINFLDTYFIPLALLVTILFLTISYILAKKFYSKREF
jgi:hypothetical protein